MYALFEIPREAKELLDRSREILPKVLSQVQPLARAKLLPATENIYADESRRGKLYVLSEGVLSLWVNDGNLLSYEEGDLIGLEQQLGAYQGRYASDFAVRADEYSLSSMYAAGAETAERWSEFMLCRLSAQTLLIAALSHGEREYQPQVKSYHAGDVIIEQGSTGNEVYTLVEGRAEAFVDGVKVGEVEADEIFGALAALTGTPRSATVIAVGTCLVLSLEKEKFLDLIQQRPATALKLFEDMARTIVALNAQVVSLSPQGAAAAPKMAGA